MSAAMDSLLTNPFPGLRPFREDEEHLFFGRENQVDAMVNKLADTRFLAVVGTSGSGKSSLVNCGLRPALRQGLMARAGTAWRMAQFRPGNDPIGVMARALAQDGVLFREHAEEGLTLAEIIETTLRMSKVGLIDICEQAGLGKGVNLLVVVDQFEELFRYRALAAAGREGAKNISEDAAAFVNLLLEVKERATCQIYVVLTMRSDFLGDCTQFPGLAEAINVGQYLVPRMTRDERRAAIEGPIRVGGTEIAPVLLTRLVNDVGDNPDQLSILQHALNRTWALWQNEGSKGPLDLTHYEAIGTMAHALDQHAEQAYAELGTTRQQQICEKLFKALTDKANDPRGVRRPTSLGELCGLADAKAAEVADVIGVFRDPTRSFLMPPTGEALEAWTVIDISHESLMRVWQRLIKWTDEEARSARTYCRLADTADLHAAGNANLLRDPELQVALDWRQKSQPNETWASRYHPGFAAAMRFLTESSEAREAERAERERQRQREREAEREKAEAQARYARLMGWAALVSGALALVALGGGIWAFRASQIANNALAAATQTANEMVTDLAGKFRHRTGMPVDLTVEILAGAQELQRKLAELGEPTPDLRYGQAVALNELAAAYADQGKSDEGVKAGEQARDILVDLLRLQPANTLWKQSLADSHHRIGRAHRAANESKQALTAYRAGLAMREQLHASDPSNSEWQSLIAESRSAIGDTMLEAGNKAGALESYRKSLAIAKRLAADYPDDPRWQARLGTSLMEVAVVLPDDQRGEKLETLRAGVKVLQKAANAKSDNTQWRRDLSYGYAYLSTELVAANEYEAAFDAAQNGIEIVKGLRKGDPDNADWQAAFSFVHGEARRAFVAAGREDKVREIDDEAHALEAELEKRDAASDSDSGKKP